MKDVFVLLLWYHDSDGCNTHKRIAAIYDSFPTFDQLGKDLLKNKIDLSNSMYAQLKPNGRPVRLKVWAFPSFSIEKWRVS